MDVKALALLIPISGIVFGSLMWVLIVWFILRARSERNRLVYDTAIRLADKGQPVPPELFANLNPPGSDLRRGVVLLALGAALCIGLYEVGAPWTFGFIPGFVGIGFLLVWWFERRGADSQKPAELTLHTPNVRHMTVLNDNVLIQRVIAQGDHHAFSELVKRHQSQLRASLRKMTGGQMELADDVAQETFILAWKNIDKFRFEAKFSTWLYRIAFNCWQSDVRRKSEVLMDDADLPESGPDDATPSHAAAVGMSRDIARAMVCLSDIERAAIHACYYNDLSHDEAAYALAIPLGTLKTHVLRAKEKMRQHLEDYAAPDEAPRKMKSGVPA